MKNRVAVLLFGICWLFPCLLVIREAAKLHDLRNDFVAMESRTEHIIPQTQSAFREVAELRRGMQALESDLCRERLQNLPQDAADWHLSLILQPDWQTRPAEKAAYAAVDRDPHLKAMKAKVKWHLLTTDDPIYRRDFAAQCPVTPCLLLTRADGTVIYKESGTQLGAAPRALYRAVEKGIRRHCPDGICIPPLRFPDATPIGPKEKPEAEPVPDTASSEAAGDEDLLPLFVAGFIGFVAVIFFVIRKDLAA